MANGERRQVKLPGGGCYCEACGSPLPDVARTTRSDGFILRERRCINPKCKEKLNVTVERTLTARSVGIRRVIRREDYL